MTTYSAHAIELRAARQDIEHHARRATILTEALRAEVARTAALEDALLTAQSRVASAEALGTEWSHSPDPLARSAGRVLRTVLEDQP